MALLGDCRDSDINDVYQRDISRMERVVMSKVGILPFLADEPGDELPGFFIFEMFTEHRWVMRRKH